MSFSVFPLHPTVAAGISTCGYITPTPIQKEAIPPILAGRDLLGLAQTGTGKTAAFVLPMLERLHGGPLRKVRALIVAPTRELAEQIHNSIIALGSATKVRSVALYGGVGKTPQLQALRGGVEIVVACPGRLLDLLNEKALSLVDVEMFVLDEADHMLDKGFLPDIRRIIKQLPQKRQSLVFSATMPAEIRHLVEDLLHQPATVQINHQKPAPTISHTLIEVTPAEKTPLLKSLLGDSEMTSTLVFTRTKHRAKNLALQLTRAGFPAASLQGNLSQQKRQQALDGFRDGTFGILVATDIAARGIDVTGISHVINYDVPDTAETYTHRTGRTGRANRGGQALTFAAQEDAKMITQIERCLGRKMLRQVREVPAEEARELHLKESTSPILPTQRPMQRPKSRGNGRGGSQKSRASAIDFGLRKHDK